MVKLGMPSKADLSAPFQSKQAFVEFIQAPKSNEGQSTIADSKWSNKDLEPTPVEDRTWTWYAFDISVNISTIDNPRYNLPLYWFSNQFSLVGWNTGSALVTVGLVCSHSEYGFLRGADHWS